MSNSAPMPPLEDEDIVGEILCRLPPQPSSVLRASIACKLWGRVTASAAFRRHRRAHHRHAPVLGVYEKYAGTLRFIPALDAPDRIPPERLSLKVCGDHAIDDDWAVLGCRQGRVLVINRTRRELLVFDPFSGDLAVIAFPLDFIDHRYTTNGAVVCDSEDQGVTKSLQLECGKKFWVVLLGASGKVGEGDVTARVYSSETGMWGDLVWAPEGPKPCRVGRLPCTLVGNGLYWWLAEPLGSIIHFDLGTQKLTIIERPPVADINIGSSRIIRVGDCGVGLAVLSYPTFRLYHRKVGSHGAITFVMRKVIEMDKILGFPTLMNADKTYITGYTEDADAIVMSVHDKSKNYLYVVQLDSMLYKKIDGHFFENAYHLFANFYTGGPSALRPFAPSDNDGGTIEAEDGASIRQLA